MVYHNREMDLLDADITCNAEAAQFGYELEEDRAARTRVPARKGKKKPARTRDVVLAELTELTELTDGRESLDENFTITYMPARYEAIWLMDSLRPFAERALIQDVLAIVKGGKEANVHLCAAVPATGYGLIAAKVYRPRRFRNLRNDKVYREGRELVDNKGMAVKARDNREMRAIRKKTDFGATLTHTSWLMYEHLTLERLFAAGASAAICLRLWTKYVAVPVPDDRRAL